MSGSAGLRVAGTAGIVAPLVWFFLLFLAGAQRPGYDHVRQYMTELTVGPTAPIALLAFYIVGVLLVVFAAGTFALFGAGSEAALIALLVGVKGISTVAAGVLQGDADPLVRTASGQAHSAAIALGNLALTVACLVAARRMRSTPGWHDLAGYTAITAVAIVILLVALATLTTAGTGRADAPLAAWGGLVQRLSMLAGFLWPAVIGQRAISRSAP